MPSRFSSGKFSISECDRCGFRFKLTKLKSLTIKTKRVNILVCPECWEKDHPQLQLGMYPVNDPQAVRDPRRDNSYPQSRSYTEVINIGPGLALYAGVLTTNGQIPTNFDLDAAFGSYGLTGFNATLRQASKLDAATGTYSLTGFSADLRESTQLNAESGAYLYTGVAATLIYSAAPITGTSFFSGGTFQGGFYAGGYFSATGGGSPTTNKFFSGGMFKGGFYAGGFFSN